MTPRTGLASVMALMVLVALPQFSAGMGLNNFGVEKCEPSIIPRWVRVIYFYNSNCLSVCVSVFLSACVSTASFPGG